MKGKKRTIDSELKESIMKMIFEEHHPSCLKKIFRLVRKLRIPLVNLEDSVENNRVELEKLWNRAQSLIDSPAKNDIVSFLGYCFFTWCCVLRKNGGSDSTDFGRRIAGEWIKLIEESSGSDQLLDLRMAACSSISSGLSNDSSSSEASSLEKEIAVRVWITVLVLLEDEEENLREKVSKFVSRKYYQSHNDRRLHLSFRAGKAKQIVMEILFKNHLDSVFQDYLLSDLQMQEQFSAFGAVEDTRKLFEKEEDNNYAEEAVMIQLRTLYLTKLAKTSPSIRSLIESKRSQLESTFNELMKRLRESKEKIMSTLFWSQSVMHAPEFFLPLYRIATLLVLCGEVDGKSSNHLLNGEGLEIHPIIQNLLEGKQSPFFLMNQN
eukprot:TRINITY_DN6011_c0_g1_i3.p1 TRINITY_DN6011_c0_g1~~TRINITY_DN6011_c0_g1_i3.p1  ORF type:complete len:379 (-),score=187.82 TRINITY_DN6011_c0_g1_i3:25-1161(-)